MLIAFFSRSHRPLIQIHSRAWQPLPVPPRHPRLHPDHARPRHLEPQSPSRHFKTTLTPMQQPRRRLANLRAQLHVLAHRCASHNHLPFRGDETATKALRMRMKTTTKLRREGANAAMTKAVWLRASWWSFSGGPLRFRPLPGGPGTAKKAKASDIATRVLQRIHSSHNGKRGDWLPVFPKTISSLQTSCPSLCSHHAHHARLMPCAKEEPCLHASLPSTSTRNPF